MERYSEWEATGQKLALGGHAVFVQRRGEGRWCTLLHGFPTSSYDWAPIAGALAEDRALLSFDYPGFGSSDKPVDHAYTTFERADLVEALWAQFGVTETDVVAHDIGDTVLLELLARRRDGAAQPALRSLVWLNGGVYADLHRQTPGQMMLLAPGGESFAKMATRELFVMQLRATLSPTSAVSDDHLAELWQSVIAGTDSRTVMHLTIRYILERAEHRDRWEPRLGDLPCRSLFLWGLADPVSGEPMFRRIEQAVAGQGHDLVELDDVGHYPQVERPDVVAARIRQFWRGAAP